MHDELISICTVGDLVLDQPGPMEQYFAEVKDELTDCDLLICHVETAHTDRPQPASIDATSPPSPPEHLDVLKSLNCEIATTACNHAYDCGPYGITDTLDRLHSLGIKTAGTGADIYEARKAAVVEKKGLRIGVIDFNASGPKIGWASSIKPGCSYVNVHTVYTPSLDMPHAPAKITSYMEPDSEAKMKELISDAKKDVDILIAAYHKGCAGTSPFPGWLATYEIPMCHAAIDAGADIVIGEHHHMLKGIEFYKGKPIYHGLGHFVAVTYALTPGYNDTPEMLEYMRQRRIEGRGMEQNATPFYPWKHETTYTMIAKLFVDKNGCVKCGYVPCQIDSGAVVRLKYQDRGGQEVFDFVKSVNDDMQFKTEFKWSEDGRFIWVSEAGNA